MIFQELSFYFACVVIGVTRRPRNAKTVRNRECQADRGFQTYAVPLGNIDRPHTGASAEHSPNMFVAGFFVNQWNPTPGFGRQFSVRSDEDAFGASDRRTVQNYPEMRRQAEASRMGVALPITEEQVRHRS